jgi:hypothetical protein
MKYSKLVLLALAIILAVSGCKKKDSYDDMARAMCDCMKPMAEMYNKMQALTAGGDTEQLANLMGDLERVASEAEACTSEMEKKYGEPKDPDKADEALRRICPEVVSAMERMDEGLE